MMRSTVAINFSWVILITPKGNFPQTIDSSIGFRAMKL